MLSRCTAGSPGCRCMRSFTLGGTEYDSVIFDCDGVLLDSNRLKIDAFREAALASGFNETTVERFSKWQSLNFGTSRYRVFERLLSADFGPVPTSATLDHLLSEFGERVRAGYLDVPEAPGLRDLLEMLAGLPLYVASGSDEKELREVFQDRGLAVFFREIYGSPTPKSQIVGRIVESSPGARAIFVGDAHADADAAQQNSIDFVFLEMLSTVGTSMAIRAGAEGFAAFAGLEELATAIRPGRSTAHRVGAS
jgi:phosphoglycolate phosphatase-like HAD superfamily hydrolase